MLDHPYRERQRLRASIEQVFSLVADNATTKQWEDWLRPPVRRAWPDCMCLSRLRRIIASLGLHNCPTLCQHTPTDPPTDPPALGTVVLCLPLVGFGLWFDLWLDGWVVGWLGHCDVGRYKRSAKMCLHDS